MRLTGAYRLSIVSNIDKPSQGTAMLFRHILLALVLAAIAGVVVVPFIIGFVRGPQARKAQTGTPAAGDPMRPLSRVAGSYGRFLMR